MNKINLMALASQIIVESTANSTITIWLGRVVTYAVAHPTITIVITAIAVAILIYCIYKFQPGTQKAGQSNTSNPSGPEKAGQSDTSNPSGAEKAGQSNKTNPSGPKKAGQSDTSNPSGPEKAGPSNTSNPHPTKKAGKSNTSNPHPAEKVGQSNTSNPVDQKNQTEYLEFCSKDLNADNVFNYLKNAKIAKAEADVIKCLDYISKETGVKILVKGDSSLSIETINSIIPLDQLSKEITSLSKIFDNDKLVLTFTPKKSDGIPAVEDFIKIHGQLMQSLDLKGFEFNINDELIKKLIQSTPNLCELFISCVGLNGEGLAELSSLKNLKILNLSFCFKLTKLPENLPASITTLDLSFCYKITKLPKNLPAGLTSLNLNNCHDLSDNARLKAFSSMLDKNFDQSLSLLSNFAISDKIKLREILLPRLEKKFTDPSIIPERLLLIANFIYFNHVLLGLHDEHPLMQEAINIFLINEQPGFKNAFNIFKSLKVLFETPSHFAPKKMMLEGVDVRVNMKKLKQISQVSKITRDDLPANVTLETFDKLFSNLKNKVKNNYLAATIALKNLGTNWVTIETPILGDPTQQLRNLLKNSEGNLSETEIKWKAVLSNVLDKDNNKREGEFFTEQEEVFITTMMGIQECSGGKEVGIASSYELLESKYRYQINLSKALSVMEMETEDKKIKGVNFVKEFMNSQPVDTPIDTIADNLVKYVKKDRDRTINITPRIEDESFWTEDLALNKLGALELLKIVKREEIKDFISQLIGQKIQKLIEFQFSGTNDLMKELTGLDVIEQVAHQSIYLKNLIGHLVGVSQTITFDRHTSALCDELVARNRDDVLSVFFKYITPQFMVNEITRSLKEASVETINALKAFLPEDRYWDKAALNKLGALELLRTLDYLA